MQTIAARVFSFLFGLAAIVIFLQSMREIVQLFRQRGLPWTTFSLFLAAMTAAFVAAFAGTVPLLARIYPYIAKCNLPLPQISIRMFLFILISGGISFVCLKILAYTRFLAFLPNRLIGKAALMIMSLLFLLALISG